VARSGRRVQPDRFAQYGRRRAVLLFRRQVMPAACRLRHAAMAGTIQPTDYAEPRLVVFRCSKMASRLETDHEFTRLMVGNVERNDLGERHVFRLAQKRRITKSDKSRI